MIRPLILFLLFFCIGCNNLTEADESPNQFMEISINDKKIKISSGEFVGNENCNTIFISASVDKLRIEFALSKDGFIKDVVVVDYSDNHDYRTADFNPSGTFSVQNYLYDNDTKLLTLIFSGILYDLSDSDNTISIDGKIKFNTLNKVGCSFEPWSMKADLNDDYFSCPTIFGESDSEITAWVGFSDSGIKLTITTADALKDMAVGKYIFTQEDILNTLMIEKYIGEIKASSFKSLNSNEWESYQCEGELIIEEQIEGAKPHTKGSFTFKAFKNKKLVYEVKNGEFSI